MGILNNVGLMGEMVMGEQESKLPAAISEDELAFHKHALASLQAAQHVCNVWLSHLASRYSLKTGDQIGEDGVIYRMEL